MSSRILQGSDLKTSAESGGDANLNPDTQIYVTGNSLNKLFSAAVIAQDFSASIPQVITNAATPYSMTSTVNRAVLKNTGTGIIIYQLPTAVAGKNFTFIQGAGQRTDEIQILPESGASISLGNNVTVNPGHVKIIRRGVQVTLVALNSTTWIVQKVTSVQHQKNTSIGVSDKELSLVGRNTWVARATGGTAREELAGFSLNGYGYICSGTTGANTSEANQFNDSTNAWIGRAGAGTARTGPAGFALNGFGYNCGGFVGAQVSTADQFNDSTNAWVGRTGIGTARYLLAGFSLNGYGYVCNGNANTNEVNQHNDSANTWTIRATGGTSRHGIPGFQLNGYGYIYGGFAGANTSEANQYNDSSNTWVLRAGAGTARSRSAGFSVNGYGYHCNGQNPTITNEVNQYDDSTNTWIIRATGGTARTNPAGFSVNGYGYLCNGNTGAVTNEVNQYN
ncbi:MAG: hypothetical protein SGI96_21210 [Bacteroidota bacterium]|nr:hypothetical protein [Bacteroidota bacterium]